MGGHVDKASSIKETRDLIDSVDDALVKLLVMRMQCSQKIRGLKTTIEDPLREHDIIERVRALATDPLDPEFCESIFRAIIHESKRIQALLDLE